MAPVTEKERVNRIIIVRKLLLRDYFGRKSYLKYAKTIFRLMPALGTLLLNDHNL